MERRRSLLVTGLFNRIEHHHGNLARGRFLLIFREMRGPLPRYGAEGGCMKPPHTLADLPFAADLRLFDGELELDGDYDRVRFSGSAFSDVVAGGSRFAESAFTGVTFDGGRLRRARMSDVWFSETRFVALDIAKSSWTDVWLSGCVLAGAQAFAGVLRRVTFRGCKLDSVNFRDCSLTDA